jgi:predicted lipid-binding transport protein (Tim44 family)
MPLSEQEQRLLDEMERSLYRNDADFVSAVSGRGRVNYGALVLGILVAILGLGVVIAGVILHQPLIGLLGFVAMFAGVLLALRRTKRAPKAAAGTPFSSTSTPTQPKDGSRGFMDKLGDRWDRRDGDERGE